MMNEIISSTNITVHPTEQSRIHEVDFNNLVFGKKFSDHMFEMKFSEGEWNEPVIKPFGTFEVTPASNVLHYGQAVFEGMKAFYVDENTVNIYRPETHHERFNHSCRRMCIPETSYETFIDALETLIRLDHQWVPKKNGTALYIRPFIFASDNLLAARSSDKFTYQIITSPVGAYYAEGFNPVSLTTPEKYVRAVVGGTGNVKTAGNYAASFLPAQKAKEKGFTQVLWLDAKEQKYIEEVGTMNIHFLIGDTLITPGLNGSILPGVTRRSVIALAKEWGYNVEERKISIDEVFEAYEDGSLKEVFGSGTAAVVSPVGLIEHNGKTIELDREKPGEFAQKCFNEITDIQYGRKDDQFGWVHPVNI
ncbi:MAG: branched-chain amino acid aminotransferase [Gracilimonas sp.]|uniref:branched-chain amino acid aminotransferase n=1 Tax=Gracilimonas TaxID=649462 RepID=UPI001B0256CE|nr:branched-chain amino acid aminotransferase [Gracilimonas sp.]MBO6585724.1 branched-chain amino acid aminotransferase [Gracilimonas sp.]MBO6616721.1 branched-chain amino acid aminotransferase [Gracilimonas sp.]